MPTAACMPIFWRAAISRAVEIPPAATMGRRVERRKFAEPREIHAAHGAFAVYIGAEKTGAIGFEGGHDFGGSKRERFAPAVNDDAAFGGVQGDQDVFFADAIGEAFQERNIGALLAKGGAADNDLFDAQAD